MNKKGFSSWLGWALLFFILSLVAGVFGFGLIAGVSFEIGKLLAIAFIVLFIVSVVAHTIKSA